MNTIPYLETKILLDFGTCCDTCEYRPFGRGYSGRRNTGYCKEIDSIVCRSNLCERFKPGRSAIAFNIRGMKTQANYVEYLKED